MVIKHGACFAVPSGWSDWSTWSPCSSTCGMGLKHRNRKWINPSAPVDGGHFSSEQTEYDSCTEFQCKLCHLPMWLSGLYNFEEPYSKLTSTQTRVLEYNDVQVRYFAVKVNDRIPLGINAVLHVNMLRVACFDT